MVFTLHTLLLKNNNIHHNFHNSHNTLSRGEGFTKMCNTEHCEKNCDFLNCNGITEEIHEK